MPTPMDELTDVDAARIRARYPASRVPRRVAVVVGIVLAAVAVGWVAWAGYVHANPAVSGQIQRFSIDSDTQVSFVLTVDRPDPSVPVHCRVIAQGKDFQRVGSTDVPIGPSPDRIVDVDLTMPTIFRAAAVSVDTCWADG